MSNENVSLAPAASPDKNQKDAPWFIKNARVPAVCWSGTPVLLYGYF
ncbi:hypothetical protein [Klebsiella michiganensis]|nr:hypothetical protein [Klebsiella michiganensis]